MARVTIEDCLNEIPNRFDIVVYAAKRARQIEMGADPLLDPEGDKPAVIALREIGDKLTTIESIERSEAVAKAGGVDFSAME